MPVFPKCLYTIAAGLASAKAGKRLLKTRPHPKAQENTLAQLLASYAQTKQGRELGINAQQTYAQFAEHVPLQTYESIRPMIERMQQGEADVLWPGQCPLYVRTSGVTDGKPKLLPVTDAMLLHLRQAIKTATLLYTTRVGHVGVFRGRHLFHHHSSTALTPLATSGQFQAYEGSLAGICAITLPPWVEKHLYEPGASIAKIEDPRERRRAIFKRTHRRDITALGGNPHQLLKLAQTICRAATRGKTRPLNLLGIWPNLECVVHGGEALGAAGANLRHICGPDTHFHEIYLAAEGLIAAQDSATAPGLRLLEEAGIFYEFLPLSHFHEDRLTQSVAHVIPLAEVKSGVNYVLIISTPAGLCRYVTGDIVQFSSTTHHRIVPMGRTRLRLNTFGENVLEKQLTDSLLKVCATHSWVIIDFHIAPLTEKKLTGQTIGRHEWWIELEPGTVDTPTGPILSAALDKELCRRNSDYAAKRNDGILEAPFVRLVIPGVFAHWLAYNGTWHAQGQIPHCHEERVIADGLAQLARFTKDV